MLLASLTAVLSALVGALLGRAGVGKALGAIRALALGASLATVFGVLLPEAVVEVGAAALAPFLGGALLPGIVERAGKHVTAADGHRLALELSYGGLVLHQLGDGLAMGALGAPGAEHAHPSVLVAVFGHTVPIVAAVFIAFATAGGRLVAWRRVGVLGAAALVGVAVTAVPSAASLVSAHHGWVEAAAGGLLLHVVLHDVEAAPAATPVTRAIELVCFGVGAAIPALVGHPEHRPSSMSAGLVELALAAAPALAVGVAVAAAVSARRGAGYLARLDPLLPRVLPLALLGAVVLLAVPALEAGGPWAALLAAAAIAVAAFVVNREVGGLGALARAVVVFAGATAVPFALGRVGIDPTWFGAGAIAALAAVALRVCLIHGVRALFGALLPLHHHASTGEHDQLRRTEIADA